MSTCGEPGSDVHALIKELALRRVDPEHGSEIRFDECRHLAEGTEVARLTAAAHFCFYSWHFHSARGIIFAAREWRLGGIQKLHSQGPVPLQVLRSEVWEGANGDGSGVGEGSGDGWRGAGEGARSRDGNRSHTGREGGNITRECATVLPKTKSPLQTGGDAYR